MTGYEILLYITVTLLIIICIFLVLLILIQKGRGGGLASAFGGAGGNTAFGSKTGDVLTWATSIVFGVFLVLSVATNLTANHIHAVYKLNVTQQNETTPADSTDKTTTNNPLSAPSSQPVP